MSAHPALDPLLERTPPRTLVIVCQRVMRRAMKAEAERDALRKELDAKDGETLALVEERDELAAEVLRLKLELRRRSTGGAR